MSQLAPNLSPPMQTALMDAMNGKLPNNLGAIRAKHHTLIHRQQMDAVAGTATVQGTYTFGQVARAKGVSNFPNQGNLPSDSFFLIAGVGVYIETGSQVTGAVDAEGAQSQTAATILTSALCEWFRVIHDCGVVTVKIGDYNLVDEVAGLWNFPKIGGVTGVAANWGTTATVQASIASLNNGGPGSSPYRIAPMYPWISGFQFLGTTDFIGVPPAPPTSLDAVISMRIDGILVSGR